MKEGNETSGASKNEGEGDETEGRGRQNEKMAMRAHHIWACRPEPKREDNVDE